MSNKFVFEKKYWRRWRNSEWNFKKIADEVWEGLNIYLIGGLLIFMYLWETLMRKSLQNIYICDIQKYTKYPKQSICFLKYLINGINLQCNVMVHVRYLYGLSFTNSFWHIRCEKCQSSECIRYYGQLLWSKHIECVKSRKNNSRSSNYH